MGSLSEALKRREPLPNQTLNSPNSCWPSSSFPLPRWCLYRGHYSTMRMLMTAELRRYRPCSAGFDVALVDGGGVRSLWWTLIRSRCAQYWLVEITRVLLPETSRVFASSGRIEPSSPGMKARILDRVLVAQSQAQRNRIDRELDQPRCRREDDSNSAKFNELPNKYSKTKPMYLQIRQKHLELWARRIVWFF